MPKTTTFNFFQLFQLNKYATEKDKSKDQIKSAVKKDDAKVPKYLWNCFLFT